MTIGTADFTAQKFYSYDDMPKGETIQLKSFLYPEGYRLRYYSGLAENGCNQP